jgi:hypothetical protein
VVQVEAARVEDGLKGADQSALAGTRLGHRAGLVAARGGLEPMPKAPEMPDPSGRGAGNVIGPGSFAQAGQQLRRVMADAGSDAQGGQAVEHDAHGTLLETARTGSLPV